jgi:hypothetical protein
MIVGTACVNDFGAILGSLQREVVLVVFAVEDQPLHGRAAVENRQGMRRVLLVHVGKLGDARQCGSHDDRVTPFAIPIRVEFDTRQIRSLRGLLAEAIQGYTADTCRVTLDRQAAKRRFAMTPERESQALCSGKGSQQILKKIAQDGVRCLDQGDLPCA